MNVNMLKFAIGDIQKSKIIVKNEKILKIADITGDCNPIHLDDNYASQTIFGKRISHGLICLGEISRLLGMVLPGEGTILLNQQINYRRPVFVDDEIETSVEIININPDMRNISLIFKCVNQNEKVVLEGNTVVKMS